MSDRGGSFRRMSVVPYRDRLRPGAAALAALLGEWDRCRWAWNQAVARLNESGEWVRDDVLTSWRREHDWLREGSVVAQQQMLRNFRAKRAKGQGRRKFKSAKRTLPSLNYTRRGFAIKDRRLYLAGGLCIPVVWSRELPSDPGSVRVYRDSIGHTKVARQRRDAARKWARKVVANYGALAVEDFKPRFLAESRMARKSADGAIGATKAVLIEYARPAGRKVVLVPPAYPTMTCSGCGARATSRLLLSQRVFVCGSCGMIEDRDRNASRVILDRAGLNPAGAEAVRHSDLLEVRVLAEPEIPFQ